MLWFGGNVVYTLGASMMGPLGTIAGWPMLLVCMVLSTNMSPSSLVRNRKATTPKSTNELIAGLIILVIGAIVGQLGTPTSSNGGGGAATPTIATTTPSPAVSTTFCCGVGTDGASCNVTGLTVMRLIIPPP